MQWYRNEQRNEDQSYSTLVTYLSSLPYRLLTERIFRSDVARTILFGSLEITTIFEQLLVNIRFYADVINNRANERRQGLRTLEHNKHHTLPLYRVQRDWFP